ncbi:cytochrome c [Imbroritus primus]|uniref:Cytochrome c n=1 Tax=Imbroritus primus TaxID=3058603 RepID=A0ACD3SLQ6_9BURK|nr:cytochrome c [Burkholderiaceae bacterium PBA]
MDARNPTRWIAAAILACSAIPLAAGAADPSLGRIVTDKELAGWNIDVFPDGTGLPPGKGTVALGEKVYQTQCVACHGAKLEGGLGPALVGGAGTLKSDKPIKTVGSYWPYATTLFDYIRRSMPFQAPQSLSNEDVYSVTAYVLHANGVLPADATIDAKSLAAVKMPNRNGFYVDDRPDAKNPRCMKDCPTASAAKR